MKKYKKKMGALLIKLEDGYAITLNSNVFRVNEVGARIFHLCNGKNTEKTIVNELLLIYSVKEEEVIEDVKVFINKAKNNNLLV